MSKTDWLRSSGSVNGKPVVGFHLRMVWVAAAVAWVTIGAVAIALVLQGGREGQQARGVVFALLVAAAVANSLAYTIPWHKLFARYDGPSIFYAWSLALFAFGALVVYLTPALDSLLFLLFFPMVLFAVATLDRRGQIVVSVLGGSSYAVAAQLSAAPPPGELFLRLVGLVLVALLGGYITGEQRATALENARLYAESQRADQQVREVFNRFGKALALSSDLGKTLQLITDLAVEVVGSDAAVLVLLDQHGEKSLVEAASGRQKESLRRFHELAEQWLVSSIVRSRAALQVPVVAVDARFARLAGELPAPLAAYLGVPLLLRGRVVGVLAIGRTSPGRFPAVEVELLASFANQAAVAVENSRLFLTLQERLRELSGLHEISLAFAALTKLADTYGQLVERIGRLLDVERCVILLPDESGHFLAAQEPAYGLTAEQVDTMHIPIGERSAAARVWLSGRPYLTNDAQTDPRNLHRWAKAFGDRSLAIVPMRVEGKTVGLLRASNKRSERFTNNDVRLLTIFATQAAVALRNAMLYGEVADQRARLEAIFDSASDGIMIVDHLRTILAFNRAMEALTGWQAEEAIGLPCREVCKSRDAQGLRLCDESCPIEQTIDREQPGPYFEIRLTTKDGHPRDVGVSYSILKSPDGALHGIAIMRDISKTKELERVKSQFISTVSHELRTPLASIKASIGLLLASVPQTTPEPFMRLLQNIERSTRRLESLVSDLLDLARLQSGRVKLTPRRLDLREVVNAVAATMRPLFEEKGQLLELQLPAKRCRAIGDRQRLEQVLLNLLSNAHKYTPAGGKITVKVGRPQAFGEDQACLRPAQLPPADPKVPAPVWWIVVADTGAGIPAQEQAHIFERFYRVEDEDTQRSVGTGLGLPIAKALVDLHGGRIWFESRQGEGSAFYFSVPEEGNYEDSGD